MLVKFSIRDQQNMMSAKFYLQLFSFVFPMAAIRGGADKSLARPTPRCCRTESIVLLERGVCSCAKLQVFSCYRGWRKACQEKCTISTTSRRELSSSFFFPCNPEETGLPGLPMSCWPTLFSGSGPIRLAPAPWTEKTIKRSPFFVRRGG